MINDHACHKASTSKKSHKFPYNFIRSLLTRLNYLVVRAHLADTLISQWGSLGAGTHGVGLASREKGIV